MGSQPEPIDTSSRDVSVVDLDMFPASLPTAKPRSKKRDRNTVEEEDDSEGIKLLRDIQLKLKLFNDKFSTIEKKIDSIDGKLSDHIIKCGESSNQSDQQHLQTAECLINIKNDVKNMLEKVNTQSGPSNVAEPTTQEALEMLVDEQQQDTMLLKYNYIPQWGSKHRDRRNAYYKYLLNKEEANIMEGWLRNNYIMKKFRPKFIQGETQECYNLREQYAYSGMRLEIEQKRLFCRNFEEKYKNIDEEISILCEEISDENEKDILKRLWREEVTNAEKNSKELWTKKKRHWWLNRPHADPYEKPRDPVNINDQNRDQEQAPPYNVVARRNTEENSENNGWTEVRNRRNHHFRDHSVNNNMNRGDQNRRGSTHQRRGTSRGRSRTRTHQHVPMGNDNTNNVENRSSSNHRGRGISRGRFNRGNNYNRGFFRGNSRNNFQNFQSTRNAQHPP